MLFADCEEVTDSELPSTGFIAIIRFVEAPAIVRCELPQTAPLAPVGIFGRVADGH